ncbi:MAG TPA: SCO family protein [Acidobacteriota bacterium]|nr:SCO family protein [Acidobacteriota bacterium]
MPIKARRFFCFAVLLLVLNCRKPAEDSELTPMDGLGGNFTLTGTDGKPFELASLRGRMVFLFFGYTACPDACPATMACLSRVYENLREKGIEDHVRTVFISVDPERDTPDKLKQYLDYFSVKTIGLTGKPAELATVAKQYGASFEKVQVNSAARYVIDHTTYVYLIDGSGRVRHLIKPEDPPEKITGLAMRLARED